MKEYNGQIYFNQSEAAKALKVARVTLWQKVRAGKVPVFDVLGEKMIPKEFVDKVLAANFELLDGSQIKGYKGRREHVTKTSELHAARAARKVAKNAAKSDDEKK